MTWIAAMEPGTAIAMLSLLAAYVALVVWTAFRLWRLARRQRLAEYAYRERLARWRRATGGVGPA